MSDIFISHIHEDEIVATALKRFIRSTVKRAQVRDLPKVFVSSSELQLGDEWLDKIRDSLKSAKLVIALFSPDSVHRPWVNFEAGGAWFSADKKLIPLCIGGLKPVHLPKPYSNIQGANLDDEGTPYYLIQSLWKVLPVNGLIPPPFYWEDVAAHELKDSIERWEVAVRARQSTARIDAMGE